MLVSMFQQPPITLPTPRQYEVQALAITRQARHVAYVTWQHVDLDGVMPTHVEDLLAIPEQLATGPLRIASVHAQHHQHMFCLLIT